MHPISSPANYTVSSRLSDEDNLAATITFLALVTLSLCYMFFYDHDLDYAALNRIKPLDIAQLPRASKITKTINIKFLGPIQDQENERRNLVTVQYQNVVFFEPITHRDLPPLGPNETMFYETVMKHIRKSQPDEHVFFCRYQPIQLDVAVISTFFLEQRDALADDLNALEGPYWKDSQLFIRADDLMTTAYTLAMLTLKDLENYNRRLKQENIKVSLADLLAGSDFYQHEVLGYLTKTYDFIRNGKLDLFTKPPHSYKYDHQEEEYASLFDEFPRLPFFWKQLVGIFCHSFTEHVKLKDLKKSSLPLAAFIEEGLKIKFDPRILRSNGFSST